MSDKAEPLVAPPNYKKETVAINMSMGWVAYMIAEDSALMKLNPAQRAIYIVQKVAAIRYDVDIPHYATVYVSEDKQLDSYIIEASWYRLAE